MSRINWLVRDAIDDEWWNGVVRSDPAFRHYGLTYYLDAACVHWLALAADDGSWVWPLPVKKRFPHRVYQPLLTQQLGPFGRPLTPSELEETWAMICGRYRSVRIKFNDRYEHLPFPQLTPHRNVELRLGQSYEALASAYNRNIKSNLKKAERAGLELEWTRSFEAWSLQTFRHGRGKELDVLDDHFYGQVEEIYRAFDQRNEAQTITARVGDSIAGQIMWLHTNDRLLLFFSASNEIGKAHGAMHAMLNEAIKCHAGQSVVLDFEGSNDDALAFFYRSFGGEEKVYLQSECQRLFWPLNCFVK
jgi:hypothetical protein